MLFLHNLYGLDVCSLHVHAALQVLGGGDHKDIVMGSAHGQFAILCSNKILLAVPRREQSAGGQGVLAMKIKYANRDLLDDFSQQPIGRFTRDGKKLGILHPFSSALHVWSLEEGIKMGPIVHSAADQAKFCDFCFSIDGERMAVCMNDGSVDLWSIGSTPGVGHLANIDVLPETAMSLKRGNYFNGVSFSHDGKSQETVVVCDGNGLLRWYHLRRHYSSSTMPRALDKRLSGVRRFYSQARSSSDSTRDLLIWDLFCTENGGGRLSCKFSSDGTTALIMKSQRKGTIWDIVRRTKIKSFEYKVRLGRRSNIPFPFNLSKDGGFSVVGKGDCTNAFVVCTPDTTYKEIDEQVGWCV